MKQPKLPRPAGVKNSPHPFVAAYDTLGMTQRVLAKKLGVAQQSLYQILDRARRNRDYIPPAHYIVSVCELTGQSVCDFLPVARRGLK